MKAVSFIRIGFRLFLVLAIISLYAGCGGGGGGGNNNAGGEENLIYTVSGTVMVKGDALEGVTVFMSGDSTGSAKTDANGRYSFTGLANGTYTLTPSIAGYTFKPLSRTETLKEADASGMDFAAASTKLWISDFAGNLGTVDIVDGSVTVIGKTTSGGNPIVLTDIAFDSSGDLYGITFSAFYAINKTNAQATHIGNFGALSLNSLDFNDSNKLFYAANNLLFSIAPDTGAATLIGSGGDDYGSDGDLVFAGDQLFLTSSSNLVELDGATGIGSIIGPIGFDTVYGLASDINGNLYGVSGTKILTIDKSTGTGTLLMDYSGKGLVDAWGASFDN